MEYHQSRLTHFSNITTMEQLKLTKRRASTELRHHFFSERVINIWNSFDNRTVTSGSINIFKGNLERLRQSKRDRHVCWQLMLLGLLRLNRAAGEALSGKLSGKLLGYGRLRSARGGM